MYIKNNILKKLTILNFRVYILTNKYILDLNNLILFIMKIINIYIIVEKIFYK